MSCEIQSQTTLALTESAFFAVEAEEMTERETIDSTLPDAEGELKTSTNKSYSFVVKESTPFAKEMKLYVLSFGYQLGEALQKLPVMEKTRPPFMQAFKKSDTSTPHFQKGERPLLYPKESKRDGISPPTRYHTEQKSLPSATRLEQKRETLADRPKTEAKEKQTHISGQPKQHAQSKPLSKAATTPSKVQPQLTKERGDVRSATRHENVQAREKNEHSLATRQWVKEETKEWWEARAQQRRDKQGGQQGRDQEQQHEEEDNKYHVSKSASASSKNPTVTQPPKENGIGKIKKPELAPPKIGVFALYYILTKLGIASDGISNFGYKKEIELVDVETTETHKKRLEEIKEAIKKEKETERWNVAVKVFSWMTSMMAIVAGVTLIATGVGAVAGAMLIAGGVIQIANQLMELTGGWKKVAEILPGEDSEKKRAVISWMQIGIAVLCLVLSGVSVIWGGFSAFGEAMQIATNMMGGIAVMGQGVTTIGTGISGFLYNDKMSDVKKFDKQLAQLKHMRQDLMEKAEWGVDRLEKLFEDLARSLEFDEELFQADQMFYR